MSHPEHDNLCGNKDDTLYAAWLDAEEARRWRIEVLGEEYEAWSDGLLDNGYYDQQEPRLVDDHGHHIGEFRPMYVPNDFAHEE